jgi:hypothetical protein
MLREYKASMNSSGRSHVIPTPDLESNGQNAQEDRQYQKRLEPFYNGNYIHAYTKDKRALLSDKCFGFHLLI